MQTNSLTQEFFTQFTLLEDCVNSMNLQLEDTRSIIHKKAMLFFNRYSHYINSDIDLESRFRAVEIRINTLIKVESKKVSLQSKPSFIPALIIQSKKSCSLLENLDSLSEAIKILDDQSKTDQNSFNHHLFFSHVHKIIKTIIHFRKNDIHECDELLEKTFVILQIVLNSPFLTRNFSEKQICYFLKTIGKKLHYLDLSLSGSAVTPSTFLTILTSNTSLKSLKLCTALHFDTRYHSNLLDFSFFKKEELKRFVSFKHLKYLEIHHSKNTHLLAYYLPLNLETLFLKLDNTINAYLSNTFKESVEIDSTKKSLVDTDLSCLNEKGEYNQSDLLCYIMENSNLLTFIDFRKIHLSLDITNFILSNCNKVKELRIILPQINKC